MQRERCANEQPIYRTVGCILNGKQRQRLTESAVLAEMFGFCVGKCHDFNQLSQIQHLVCVCKCVCCALLLLLYQNRSFKCVFTCIVGRLLCLRLFDVSPTGEVNALAYSKSTVQLKTSLPMRRRGKKLNERKQNNTCNMSCCKIHSVDGLSPH